MFRKVGKVIPPIITRNIGSKVDVVALLDLVKIRLIEDSYTSHDHSISAVVGETLLASIQRANIPIHCIYNYLKFPIAYCGGHCACGSCAIEMNNYGKNQDERSTQEKTVLEKVSKDKTGYSYQFYNKS